MIAGHIIDWATYVTYMCILPPLKMSVACVDAYDKGRLEYIL